MHVLNTINGKKLNIGVAFMANNHTMTNYYCVRGNIRHQEKVERWILMKLRTCLRLRVAIFLGLGISTVIFGGKDV